ncbi:MAG: bifunctional trypsin-like peptidase domain-containing/SEL1-like repeat protein [Bdellovibrionales bacterium]
MRFLFKNIFLNFYFVLQIFAISMGLLCGSFSYSEKDILKDFQNYVKEDIPLEVEEVKNSVVRLGLNQEDYIGTGFILEDGILVTNVHVLSEHELSSFNQIKIFQEDQLLDIQVTSIQALDPVYDLALLNIKGSEIPLPIKKPQRKVDLTKEKLFFVGYPHGKLKAIGQKGPIEIFELEDRIEEVHMLVSDGYLFGASGSPIINQKGEIMGVLNSASISERKVMFSDNDSLFSLRNAEYGVQCSKNISIKDCFKQMEDFHLKEAIKGDTYAQYQFAFNNMNFNNHKEGMKWLEQAAQKGFVLAQQELGFYKESLKWFQLAAQQGLAYSSFQLGKMYYYGETVSQDYKKAFQYFEQAAQQGHIDSIFELGTIYYHGEAAPQDYKKAIEYFEQAAQKGNVDSIFQLGKMYYHGDGVSQDYKKAIEYIEQAAQKGYREAQYYNLSKLKYKKYISDIGKYIEKTFNKGDQ